MIYIHWIPVLLYVLLVIATVVTVLLDNRQPVKTVTWILVLIFIPVIGILLYIFFGQSYAAASNKAVEHIYDVILGIILGFGVPEAIVAGILTTAITKVLFKIMKNNG